MQEKPSSDDQPNSWRILSIYAFVAVSVVIGVPLWWKTTETYRVSLPYAQIQHLSEKEVELPVELEFVAADDLLSEENIKHVEEKLREIFSDSNRWIFLEEFRVKLRVETKAEKEFRWKRKIEQFCNEMQERVNVGKLMIYLLPFTTDFLKENSRFYISRHRIVFIRRSSNLAADLNEVKDLVFNLLVNIRSLQTTTANVISPHLIPPDKATVRVLRSSPIIDMTFNLIVPQPHLLRVKWAIQEAIDVYLRPILNRLSTIVQFDIKSKILYLTALNVAPEYDREKQHFYLLPDQLPHILNPIEAELASHVSTNPNINFVVYIPLKEQSPLQIHDSNGNGLPSNAFLSPRWGGMYIYNHNFSESSDVTLEPEKMMRIFLSQLRLLLGLQTLESNDKIYFEPFDKTTLTDWEFDYLLRKNTLENIATVSNTLRSLSQLLGEINNIVINDDVGASIFTAVESTMKGIEYLQKGDLLNAFSVSLTGLVASEKAFFDPSMLALLYFPDDQKYAVYVPLFLPVGVPVFFSIFYVIKAFKSSRKEKDSVKKKQ